MIIIIYAWISSTIPGSRCGQLLIWRLNCEETCFGISNLIWTFCIVSLGMVWSDPGMGWSMTGIAVNFILGMTPSGRNTRFKFNIRYFPTPGLGSVVVILVLLWVIIDRGGRTMIIRLLAGIIKSKLFWATLVIGLLFFTWRPQKELGPEIPIGQAGMTLLGSKIVGWKDNQPRWEVKAKTIWRSKDEKLIIFQEIQEAMIYQFKEDGTREEELFFTAPWARMEMRSNLLKIGGGIKGRIKQGEFETE